MSTAPSTPTLQPVRLIAGREVRTRLRSKGFLWMTAVFVVAVVAGGFLLSLVQGSDQASHVGIEPSAAAVEAPLKAIATGMDLDVTTSIVAKDVGTEQVRDGSLDLLLVSAGDGWAAVVKDSVSPTLSTVLTSLAQQMALTGQVTSLGGDPATVAQAVAAASIPAQPLEAPAVVDGAQVVAAYVVGILLFLSLMTCGQMISQGVVEEKSSRVVEILLSNVRPWQLMTGKVLGIGAVGLVQVALVVAAGVGSSLAFGLLDGSTIALGATALWALVWFVVGFAMYSLLLAALASLVSRQEDVGSVTSPVMGLMVVPYVVAVSIAPWDPHNTLVTVLSWVPFCSPLVMPVRAALDAASTPEMLGALALNVVLVPLLVWLAGRVYANAVLHTGGRVRLSRALRQDS